MQDLANFLVALGAKIEGIGTNTIVIHGPSTLGGTRYAIQPDHIEVGSLIGLAAVTRSPLRIARAGVEHLRSIRMGFERLGIVCGVEGDDLVVPSGQTMAAMTLAVILGRFLIAEIFLGETVDATAALTATLLLIGSTFFVTDGIQTVANGALRGMNDTRIPLLFATISYWLVGFVAAWALGFWTPLGAGGVWVGLSIGTVVFAVLLILRFRLLASRLLS